MENWGHGAKLLGSRSTGGRLAGSDAKVLLEPGVAETPYNVCLALRPGVPDHRILGSFMNFHPRCCVHDSEEWLLPERLALRFRRNLSASTAREWQLTKFRHQLIGRRQMRLVAHLGKENPTGLWDDLHLIFLTEGSEPQTRHLLGMGVTLLPPGLVPTHTCRS